MTDQVCLFRSYRQIHLNMFALHWLQL